MNRHASLSFAHQFHPEMRVVSPSLERANAAVYVLHLNR
jgi:hypothetical protein